MSAPDRVERCAISHCGQQAAYGNHAGTIRVWNTKQSLDSGKHWKAHQDKVMNIALSREGTRMVSMGGDLFIRIWDTTAERQIACIERTIFTLCAGVAFSADSRFIIYNNWYHRGVKFWKVDTQEKVFEFTHKRANALGIEEEEALTVLRECGPKSGFLWPKFKGRISGEVFITGNFCYCKNRTGTEGSNHCEKTPLAVLPLLGWEYSSVQGTLVSTLHGRLLICRLLVGDYSQARHDVVPCRFF